MNNVVDPDLLKNEDKLTKRLITDNVDKGQAIFEIYKGQVFTRASGHLSDDESLAMGHFGGNANVIINTIDLDQKILNNLCSLEAERVPVEIKTKQGKYHLTSSAEDNEKAVKMGVLEDLEIEVFRGKCYYLYPGLQIESNNMSKLAYNVARASGSWQGETKQTITSALATLKVVPVIPANARAPMGEMYGNDFKDQDAD